MKKNLYTNNIFLKMIILHQIRNKISVSVPISSKFGKGL